MVYNGSDAGNLHFRDLTVRVTIQLQLFYSPWTVSGTTRVNWYQKGKTNLDLQEQEIVSGSTIS